MNIILRSYILSAAKELLGQKEFYLRRPHVVGLQHPEGVHAPPGVAPPRWDADLREDFDRQDDHARRGGFGLHRQREGEDPGQGGHPAGPAAPHLRGQAARGWSECSQPRRTDVPFKNVCNRM